MRGTLCEILVLFMHGDAVGQLKLSANRSIQRCAALTEQLAGFSRLDFQDDSIAG